MTDDPREELDGLLGEAVRELIDDLGGDQPPTDLNDQILRHLNRKNKQTSKRTPTKYKGFTMVIKYGLAALILAAIASAIGIPGFFGEESTLYAQVTERVEQLNSLVCRVQWVEDEQLDEIYSEDGKKVTYLAPSRHRIEDPAGSIHIIDTQTKKTIYLNTKLKEALVMRSQGARNITSLSPAPLVKTLHDHFRSDRVIDEGVHELGKREIDGIMAIGLRSAMNGEIVEVWVDPKTHLPLEVRVRLVIPSHLVNGKKAIMWNVMTNFEYNVKVDESLMAMKVPDGYTEISISDLPIDHSPATLNDLIALLRTCAKHNDSLFPSSLNMYSDEEGTCMAIMKRYAGQLDKKIASGSDTERKAAIKTVTDFGSALGRSVAFLSSLKEENNLHYFAGARLNQKNRPLLWYSPNANESYKVVYADLTVKDTPADTLPVEPVQSTPKIKRKTAAWNTPMFKLPRLAVRDYASLEAIRKQGKQKTINYMVLGWMPEFIENPPRPAGVPADQVQVEVPDDWKPVRSPDSARLAFLAEFPNLKGLQLDHLFLTQKDLDIIGKCMKLEQLSLNGVQILEQSPRRRLSGNDLQKLRGLTSLKVLDLGQSNFVGGLHNLSELPHLRKLFLGSFEHLNDKSVAELQELPHLDTLILAPIYSTNPEKTVTEVGLLSLQKIPRLKTLYVGWHGKWTMPVNELRKILPNVKIKAGD